MENDFNDPTLRAINREVGMLQQQIRSLEDRAAKIKSELMGRSASAVMDVPVVENEYLGIRMTDALQNYLGKRGGGPIPLKRIAVDLAIAGVKLGKPGRHEWNIRIAMSAGNNRNVFFFDEESESVSLVKGPVAPKPPRKAH